MLQDVYPMVFVLPILVRRRQHDDEVVSEILPLDFRKRLQVGGEFGIVPRLGIENVRTAREPEDEPIEGALFHLSDMFGDEGWVLGIPAVLDELFLPGRTDWRRRLGGFLCARSGR